MARTRYRNANVCSRCGCTLDAGEGRICSDCLKKNQEEEAYAKQWSMPVQMARELSESGLISA